MKNNTGEDINAYSSVGEYVYAEIRRQIINWQLKPGQRISEAEMSKVLNVSRTPVREGFIRLKNEGLVEILAQRGTIISKIDIKNVKEGVFMRRCLEREVIREIAGNMSEDGIKKGRKYLLRQEEALIYMDYIKFHEYDRLFHKLFFEEADKIHTWKILQLADTQYDRVRMLTLLDFNKFNMLIEDHKAIFNAIIEGNFEEASRDMSIHIDLVYKELELLKKEYADYFIDGQ
jgi:DNA-binding GntR family transcriptional regulator